MKFLASTATVLVLATPSFAEETLTFKIVESEAYGSYLADSEGRPVYVFSTDTSAVGDQAAQITCTSDDCLEAWPLVITSDQPQAGEGTDALLLGTSRYNADLVATYDGMPLYYFTKDADAEGPKGNEVAAFGGEWSLVDPSPSSETADLAAGETMYAQDCRQCHGRAGRGMASFPSVAGKDHEYIATKLKQYRAGEAVGPNSALMFGVAAELSDEDIANLAAYISTEFQ